jgi:hypothetical protein
MKTKYILFLIIAVGSLCYINALGGDFIWDDLYLVIQNPLIRSFANIGRIFTAELAPNLITIVPFRS